MATEGNRNSKQEEQHRKIKNTTPTTPASTEAAAEIEATAGDLLDATFADKIRSTATIHNKHTSGGGIFPWRSSPELHERLVPGTAENYSKGLLLGGNLTSSNPKMDGFATACFFLRIPFLDMVLFRNATEQDLAESMAWAFGSAVEQITGGFEGRKNSPLLKDMMEPRKLAKLFESASEFGRDSLEVKLETKPILYNDNDEGGIDVDNTNEHTTSDLPMGLRDGPKIVSLFAFPFLSRGQTHSNGDDSRHLQKYSQLLDAVTDFKDDENDQAAAESSYRNSLELSREMMEDFRQKGVSENTVICQVLVPCLETFWVKDTATGKILQGGKKQRTVLHLVRFEQTTKTHIVSKDEKIPQNSMSSHFFPFRHELGTWKITDIDDLCDGNLLL